MAVRYLAENLHPDHPSATPEHCGEPKPLRELLAEDESPAD